MKTRRFNILVLVMLLFTMVVSAADYQRTSSGMTFSWLDTDYVGVYTTSGTLVKYYPSLINGNTATFQSGFGLSDNTQYYAYSPYNENNWNKALTAIPISYLNQSQQGNGDTDRISAYDYQMASFTTSTSSADISFSHVGALLHFCWTLPVDAKATRLTLSCSDGKPFVTEATMNLTTQEITAVATADTLSLALKVVTQSKGNVLNAYLMTSPVNLTGKKLTVKLYTAAQDTLVAEINGTNVLAGYIYPVDISADETTVKLHGSSQGTDGNNVLAKSVHGSDIKKVTSISSVTAYSPNFSIDSTHNFTIAESYEKGDVNMDGEVNTTDAVMVINYYLGKTTDIDKSIADVNGDKAINTTDAVLIINKYLNK